MKKNGFNKSTFAAALIAALVFTGCQQGSEGKRTDSVPSSSTQVTQQAADATQDKNYVEKITYKDYGIFKKLSDATIPCEFTNTFNTEQYSEDYSISGMYDLNQDGIEDSIFFLCNKETMKMELTINGAKLEDEFPAPEMAYVVDVDSKDSMVDLVLYDRGMSDDPNYTFYRYDGKTITNLGTIGTWEEGAIGFDGYNRAIPMDSFLFQLEPALIKEYYEVEDNEWKHHELNLFKADKKAYTIGKELNGFFIETQDTLDSLERTWSKDEKIALHPGEKITINNIGEYESYQVELEDGRIGLLYFWTGD